jgi:hypothetical protein
MEVTSISTGATINRSLEGLGIQAAFLESDLCGVHKTNPGVAGR